MSRRKASGSIVLLTIATQLFVCLSWAQENPNAKPASENHATAREQFDLGVRHFEDSQYEASARAFLRADLEDPRSDTLMNALVAARRSGVDLLVVRVAERAIEREDIDPGLVIQARHALAEATPHVVRLRLECSPAPCFVELDGRQVEREIEYILPGSHTIVAEFSNAASGDQPLRSKEISETFAAGALYEFRLEPEKQSQPVAVPESQRAAAVPAPTRADPDADVSQKPVGSADEVVFISGLVVSAGLLGMTTWSGLAAQHDYKRLGSDPTTDEVSNVRSQIVRTDILLGATLASAAFTVGWGIFATDFRTAKVQVAVRGLGLNGRVRF